MKPLALLTLSLALCASLLSADLAEAKRLSNGGMKRDTPAQSTPNQTPAQQAPNNAAAQQTPAQQAAPAAAGTAAAAAAPKRSWMGPVAGLAAGLGLAALASHFGFGEALANIMTMVLIGLVLMMVVGFVLRRMAAKKQAQGAAPAGMQFAGMPAGMGNFGSGAQASQPTAQTATPMQYSALPSGSALQGSGLGHAAAPAVAAVPADFDAEGFAQIAKRVFIRMQAANDARDQADLRRFTTPEMFAVFQQELLDRQGTQQTDVVQLQAQVIEVVEENAEQIVSVRFSGLIREHNEAAAEAFDEIWHLSRPLDQSREWAIAGIQSNQ